MTEQDIKDKALEVYPYDIQGQYAYDANDGKRQGYIKGYQDAIQQLTKDAQECVVSKYYDCDACDYIKEIRHTVPENLNVGDKVKLIIIKE